MARTVAEIKKQMTDAFMADATIREKYGLREGDTWSGSFSTVSLESIMFFIVAACCHVLEVVFEEYVKVVDDKVSMAVVASVPWYYKMSKAFQYGDSLVLNEDTQQYGYAAIDEGKQVVKYAAVRDRGTSVQILVSGEKDGKPVALSNSVLTVFKEYMNRVRWQVLCSQYAPRTQTRWSSWQRSMWTLLSSTLTELSYPMGASLWRKPSMHILPISSMEELSTRPNSQMPFLEWRE